MKYSSFRQHSHWTGQRTGNKREEDKSSSIMVTMGVVLCQRKSANIEWWSFWEADSTVIKISSLPNNAVKLLFWTEKIDVVRAPCNVQQNNKGAERRGSPASRRNETSCQASRGVRSRPRPRALTGGRRRNPRQRFIMPSPGCPPSSAPVLYTPRVHGLPLLPRNNSV